MARRWNDYRLRAEAMGEEARERWLAAGESEGALGLAGALYTRDKAAFGSVLGSALALRMFLFVIPANVTIMGFIQFARIGHVFDDTFTDSITTGSMAAAIFTVSRLQALGIFLSSAVLTVWAGRSFARVLVASSGTAWGLTLTQSKQRMKAMGALIGVIFASIVVGSVFKAVREHTGIAIGFLVWLAVVAFFTLSWFLVMLTLPRATPDPGAIIPGALLFGLGYGILQWFMQYYLPLRIERSSDTMGQMAVTVAILGNAFFIGRLMSGSFVMTAVLFERYGSLSHAVFGLPLVRALPRKFPKLVSFFALDDPQGDPHAPAKLDSDEPAEPTEH